MTALKKWKSFELKIDKTRRVLGQSVIAIRLYFGMFWVTLSHRHTLRTGS
ncbi:hypothetical protein VIBNISO65_270040 [Vibrio nigripulchritudo SO65]|nr:hypothetical protein VIBNIAM115_1380007 [Vibrio nigripulchritudo AM115]CCN40534.1 hypothetical protein VIBNIFTn2_1330039 [Vibrio nigripulchritudo FTn2]CCN63660.1 hypothetical protein VIBNIPon4_140039 [Vibrio nigripulchritudo POn4]CCN77620.1 hypothetical protein VIBNISO65_270040 [Vibrio nigripulchritudo SO65]